jgi:chromosomal replication initiator protein
MNPVKPHASVTISAIQRAAAAAYDVAAALLSDPTQAAYVVRPRAIAVYLCREMTGASFPKLGRMFHRHHTTVLASWRQIAQQRHFDPDLDRILTQLTEAIEQGSQIKPLSIEERKRRDRLESLEQRVAELERRCA